MTYMKPEIYDSVRAEIGDFFDELEWKLAEKLACRSISELEKNCHTIIKDDREIYFFNDIKILEAKIYHCGGLIKWIIE